MYEPLEINQNHVQEKCLLCMYFVRSNEEGYSQVYTQSDFYFSTTLKLNKTQTAMFERPKHSMFDDSTTDLVLRTASKILSMLYIIFFVYTYAFIFPK